MGQFGMNISISLTPELLGLVNTKVESGRYASPSEVVREALRLLERADRLESERIEALRRAWQAGADSGDAGPLDFAELRAAAQRELVATPNGSRASGPPHRPRPPRSARYLARHREA